MTLVDGRAYRRIAWDPGGGSDTGAVEHLLALGRHPGGPDGGATRRGRQGVVTSGGGPGGLAGEIRRTLDGIHDPCSVATSVPMGLDEMGLVERVDVTPDGRVSIRLRLTSPFCEMLPFMQGEAVRRVGALPGVTGVNVSHDAGLDRGHDMIAPAARRRRELRLSVIRRTAAAPGA